MDILTDALISISLYLDISMLYYIFAIKLIHTHLFKHEINLYEIIKSFIIWGIIYTGLLLASGDPFGDLRN
jgi:hypothetical protein